MHTVWFIRHAQSEANAGLPTTHIATIKLTPRGVAQSDYIARSFEQPPTLIVTSAYIRTELTAQPTVARFPNVPCEVWDVHEFTMLAAARCVDTTTFQRRPMADEYWERNLPDYVDGEGAESFTMLITRVRATVERLRAIPTGFTAVFTHGQFIRGLLWNFLSGEVSISAETMSHFRHFDQAVFIPNGAIIQAQFDGAAPILMSAPLTTHFPSDIITS